MDLVERLKPYVKDLVLRKIQSTGQADVLGGETLRTQAYCQLERSQRRYADNKGVNLASAIGEAVREVMVELGYESVGLLYVKKSIELPT